MQVFHCVRLVRVWDILSIHGIVVKYSLASMLLCSVASNGKDRHEDLQQQEQAMAAFMDSFAANKAARLAELEGMQMAGSSRQLLSGRASVSDIPTLPFDESQACCKPLLQ